MCSTAGRGPAITVPLLAKAATEPLQPTPAAETPAQETAAQDAPAEAAPAAPQESAPQLEDRVSLARQSELIAAALEGGALEGDRAAARCAGRACDRMRTPRRPRGRGCGAPRPCRPPRPRRLPRPTRRHPSPSMRRRPRPSRWCRHAPPTSRHRRCRSSRSRSTASRRPWPPSPPRLPPARAPRARPPRASRVEIPLIEVWRPHRPQRAQPPPGRARTRPAPASPPSTARRRPPRRAGPAPGAQRETRNGATRSAATRTAVRSEATGAVGATSSAPTATAPRPQGQRGPRVEGQDERRPKPDFKGGQKGGQGRRDERPAHAFERDATRTRAPARPQLALRQARRAQGPARRQVARVRRTSNARHPCQSRTHKLYWRRWRPIVAAKGSGHDRRRNPPARDLSEPRWRGGALPSPSRGRRRRLCRTADDPVRRVRDRRAPCSS